MRSPEGYSIPFEKEPSPKKDKVDFIFRYFYKILPLIEGDPQVEELFDKVYISEDTRRAVEECLAQISKSDITDVTLIQEAKKHFMERASEEDLEHILEQFETKVVVFEKNESVYGEHAERALLFASDPLAAESIGLLVREMSTDERIQGMTLLTDGVAGKRLLSQIPETEGNTHTYLLKNKEHHAITDTDYSDSSVLVDAFFSEHDPQGNGYDVIFTTTESPESPGAYPVLTGKETFGNNKTRLYMMHDGWAALPDTMATFLNKTKDPQAIDALFCSDILSKQVLEAQLDPIYHDAIIPLGSPALDTLRETTNQETRDAGRTKLGLLDDEIAFLYVGDISKDYESYSTPIDAEVNEKTFQKTIEAMCNVAEKHTHQRYVLLFRPHPRDPNKGSYEGDTHVLPSNMRVVSAAHTMVSMPEARCAADAIGSIVSTENHYARFIGKPGVFISFSDQSSTEGLGMGVLQQAYGEHVVSAIKQHTVSENLNIVETLDDLSSLMSSVSAQKNVDTASQSLQKNFTKEVLDMSLNGSR